jgi:hypothetical protein
MGRHRLTLALAALAAATSSCVWWRDTQRWPGPMEATVDPLPPGDSTNHVAGPEEVSLIRHADPVQVRPAGALQGHPLAFYDKKVRLTAGGGVIVAPGGRAEVLWPEGTSIVLFGRGIGWVGSPSRGEPMFEFQDVDRATLQLREGDQVRLLGGALLSGASGPYVLEHDTADATLWVHNQSKGSLQVAFREELFELTPDQALLLPLLSSGGAPFSEDPALERVSGPGFNVRVLGKLDVDQDALSLRASADASSVENREARALGVRVRLAQGESVTFSSLGGVRARNATPEPQPQQPKPPPAEATPDNP